MRLLNIKPFSKVLSAVIFLSLFVVGHAVFLNQPAKSQEVNGSILTISEANPFSAKNFRLVINTALTVRLPVDVVDVTIGSPSVISVNVNSTRQFVVSALALGTTNLNFLDANGQPVAQFNVHVTPDLKTLQNYISRMVPNASIEVGYLNGTILLTGSASSVADINRAKELAKIYSDTGSKIFTDINLSSKNQVALKVNIVELSRSVVKELGIELGGYGDFQRNNAASLDFGFSKLINGHQFSAQLTALESAGYVKSVADTVISALSGEQGVIHSGGQISITNEDGETSFKDYGVKVEITPTVVSPGLINLAILAETSTPDTSTANVGGLLTRRANTKIELSSGNSMMIAGLIQQTVGDGHSGIPGLKDIPFIGQAFRSRSFRDEQTELVIIVTPYLIKGSHNSQLVTPVDNFIPSGDADAILSGQLNQPYYAQQKSTAVNTSLGYGFINE